MNCYCLDSQGYRLYQTLALNHSSRKDQSNCHRFPESRFSPRSERLLIRSVSTHWILPCCSLAEGQNRQSRISRRYVRDWLVCIVRQRSESTVTQHCNLTVANVSRQPPSFQDTACWVEYSSNLAVWSPPRQTPSRHPRDWTIACHARRRNCNGMSPGNNEYNASDQTADRLRAVSQSSVPFEDSRLIIARECRLRRGFATRGRGLYLPNRLS